MGVGNISRKMLKNPLVDEKNNNSVKKRPHVKDMKRKLVQKKSHENMDRKLTPS
jgi:hypothetical protein